MNVKGPIVGLRTLLAGMRFVFLKHTDLVRYWIWPILISLTIAVLVALRMITLHDELTEWMRHYHPQTSWIADAWHMLSGVLGVVLSLMFALAGIVLTMAFSSLIAAPFNDALSAAVERRVLNKEDPPFSFAGLLADVWRTVRIESFKLVVGACILLPLWLLALLVPVVGPVLQFVVGFFLSSMFLAVDYVDWPASRRGQGLRARLSLARTHTSTLFGFGAGVHGLLLIPGMNLLFMPAAVAGGTLLYLGLSGEYDALSERP